MFYELTDPFRMMDNTLRQFDRALSVRPRRSDLDIGLFDVGEHLALTVDLPGLEEKDVELTIEGDVLTLRAEQPNQKREGFKQIRTERPYVRLFKQIELPTRVDGSRVTASLKDGVLRVFLPKAEETKPRRIAIQGKAQPVGAGEIMS